MNEQEKRVYDRLIELGCNKENAKSLVKMNHSDIPHWLEDGHFLDEMCHRILWSI